MQLGDDINFLGDNYPDILDRYDVTTDLLTTIYPESTENPKFNDTQNINRTGEISNISEPLGKWMKINLAFLLIIFVGFLLYKFVYIKHKKEMRLRVERMRLNFLTSLTRYPWAYRALGQQEPLVLDDQVSLRKLQSSDV